MDRSGLSDIIVGRSLGAVAKNYDVLLSDGTFVRLVEGSKITKVIQIAGQGRIRKVKVDAWLSEKYGGKRGGWKKMAGDGYVDFFGISRSVHLHWYQIDMNDHIERVEFKVKRYYN